jgi:hypothetical protein
MELRHLNEDGEPIKIRINYKEDIPKILDFIKKAGFTERSLES